MIRFSMKNVRDRNAIMQHNFFSPDTMRFFNSRAAASAYGHDDRKRAYFTTSEQHRDSPRRYTVRCIEWETGDIRSVGEFQRFATQAEATKEAKRLALGGAA